MDVESKNVREKFDVDEHLVDKVWADEARGLRKELVSFKFVSVVKASELSKCLVEVIEVNNSDPEKYKSNYLEVEKELWVEIGGAVTAIDCYVEEFLRQMFTNETSKCSIATKSSGVIEFTVKLKRIEFGGYYCEQSAVKMFELAKSYKENGVKMFKEYPLFAHNYFNLAAKCLLSFNPFDDLEDLLADSSLTKTDFVELLQNVYLNIAACLVKQQRFEDILHVLSYSKTQDNPSEKAVYRLALAYFHLKQFDNAKATIERISYKNSKDLVQLMAKILENRKVDNEKYSSMVKKMFA
jgi:tetratricopeptide (TPR) repeat protein